jgi:ribosomal protein S6--L-glutamate ligase
VIYLQRYIPHPGYDLRVLILNGSVVGAIRRHNQTDFRTNISRQGRAEAYSPTESEVQLALRACELTQAEFAGVDLLTPVDEPETRYLLEVNAVPGWRGLQSATNVNVAALVIEYLEQKRNNAGASQT